MKGAAAPPICAARGRGGWRGGGSAAPAAPRPRGHRASPRLRAADKEGPWQRLPRRHRAVSSGPSGQADIPPGAGLMGPGWPLRTVHPPRRARDKRPCCPLPMPLTEPCQPSGRCCARCRSWQRPCAAAGQPGPLAQIFQDSALACGERKPSGSKACIDLSELACQPLPTLAKSGLLKRVNVSFVSAHNLAKP